MRSFDYAQDDKNIKGFTLIELLVVVLIIAILAAIALPKYMATRDKAHLVGLMTIGGNVNDALDRRSLFDDTLNVVGALDRLDISFKSNTGSDCNDAHCRIKVSGKEYLLYPRYPRLNNGSTQGKNFTEIYFYTNPAFGIFRTYTDMASSYNGYRKYNLQCYSPGGSYISAADLDEARCEKIALSFGGSCSGASGEKTCSWN